MNRITGQYGILREEPPTAFYMRKEPRTDPLTSHWPWLTTPVLVEAAPPPGRRWLTVGHVTAYTPYGQSYIDVVPKGWLRAATPSEVRQALRQRTDTLELLPEAILMRSILYLMERKGRHPSKITLVALLEQFGTSYIEYTSQTYEAESLLLIQYPGLRGLYASVQEAWLEVVKAQTRTILRQLKRG